MKGKKFGTFEGVFIPSIEAILGTVLFLILPGLTAKMGFLSMLAIIVIAHTVTIATAFSLADCATNLNTIGAGGMYALIRKSLGNAFGGSIGIQLFLAQSASIAFYAVGFAQPLATLPIFEFISGDILFKQQVIATTIFFVFFIIVFIGADFTIKIQKGILVILILSIGTIIATPFLSLSFGEGAAGQPIFAGTFNLVQSTTFTGFLIAFTQFFPAVTGIGAGVGMSGDLKDPKKSMVSGTFIAIFAGMALYILTTYIFAHMDSTLAGEKTLTELFGIGYLTVPALVVFVGIIVATASSGLSYFMTAPRTVFAMVEDNILPNRLRFLKNDIFKGGREPRLAMFLTAGLGLIVIWSGDLDLASMVVGIAFLAVYGWINFSAFLERISRNPSFRPTSKGHWLISLYGFIVCAVVVFIFNPPTSIFIGGGIFLFQIITFYLILTYKSQHKLEGVWWGVIFFWATALLKQLSQIVQGTKNWRPIIKIFAFTGNEGNNENTIHIGEMIAEYQGLVNANIISVKGDKNEDDMQAYNIPVKRVFVAGKTDLTAGVLNIIQASDFAHIAANAMLIEYDKRVDWEELVEEVGKQEMNLLLYKDGKIAEWGSEYYIDVWWRGAENGNLSALISYIILLSNRAKKVKTHVRVIRKITKHEEKEQAEQELSTLMTKARLAGKTVILEHDEKPILQTIREVSEKSSLLMIGIPSTRKEAVKTRPNIFNFVQYSFNQQVERFSDLPPVLFVKASRTLNLIEE